MSCHLHGVEDCECPAYLIAMGQMDAVLERELESLPAAACVPLAWQERDTRPLAIDLFCGLGGWAEGFLAEGFRVVGFDNGHTAPYAAGAKYPGQLVIQDVLTLHGSQFRNAAVIVASPPCQNYSYLAMPWSRSVDYVRPDGDGWEVLNSADAKEMRQQWERKGPDNRLFDACFRIQREAIEATKEPCPYGLCPLCRGTGFVTRYIPLIVENVRGAIPWVGRSAWNYGSFHLWGDVPALMPFSKGLPPKRAMDDLKNGVRAKHSDHLPIGDGPDGRKGTGAYPNRGWTQGCAITLGLENYAGEKSNPDGTERPKGSWFRIADSSQGDRGPAGQKVPAYSDPRRNGGKGVHLTNPHENAEGLKIGGDWFSDPNSTCRKHGSRSNARKMASAMIAKIPLPLAQHIAAVYKPRLPVLQDARLRGAAGETR